MMMKMKALVLDDEHAGRQRMLSLLSEHSDIEVTAVCEDLEQARRAIAESDIDVAFLDIQLPDGDGFEVLEGIPEDRRPVVVFATAYERHAVRAFVEAATDYLLKPVSDQRLAEALRRVREVLGKRRAEDLVERLEGLLSQAPANGSVVVGPPSVRETAPAEVHEERIAVRSAGRVTFVRQQDVDWLDAAGNSVRIHANGQTYRVRDTMARFEALLDKRQFARIHRSTIIRLDRVMEVLVSPHGDYVVILDGGQRLTVGRLYRERIQQLIAGRGE